MQSQLENAHLKLRQLKIKRQKIEDDITQVSLTTTKLSNLLSSPIFNLCKIYTLEDVAVIISDYSTIEYCALHETYFPKIIKQCIGCMKVEYGQQFIYELTGCLKLKGIKDSDREEIVDFHCNDVDFKYHLIKLLELEPSMHYALGQQKS